MGDFKFSADVKREDRVFPALMSGLTEGLDDSMDWMKRKGEEKGQEAVLGADRIFRHTLEKSFESSTDPMSRRYNRFGEIRNTAKHAKLNEDGLKPGKANPSVQDILPWVSDKLDPAEYGGGDGSPGFDIGSGGGGGRPASSITDDDVTVSNYRSTTELGISEQQFSSNKPRIATLEDGTNVVWKSRDSNKAETNSVIANEIVWSRAQEDLGWNLGPRSRNDSREIDGTEVEATMQEFVENASRFTNEVFLGYNDEPGKLQRDEFLNQHRDWAAKTASLDYLLGNYDRHKANIVFDDNGEPKAIDNGGFHYTPGFNDGNSLAFLSQLYDYGDAKDEDALLDENLALMDSIEDRLDDLAGNLEARLGMIEWAEEVHGEDSKFTDRLRDVIGEEVTEGHFMHEDSSGTPLYKRHLDEIREKHNNIYNNDPQDGSDTDPDEGIGDPSENFNPGDIDDVLDDLIGGASP